MLTSSDMQFLLVTHDILGFLLTPDLPFMLLSSMAVFLLAPSDIAGLPLHFLIYQSCY